MDRVLWGRIGGLRKASRYAPDELTAAARRAFAARFEHQVDPDGVLEPTERARRAEAARRAHMLSLSARSAEARRKKAARAIGSPLAAAEVGDGSAERPRAA